MALVISQDTFDEVVRENIDDLDMNIDEAAIDAIRQFKAQGVDLSNVITDPEEKRQAEGEISSSLAYLNVFNYNSFTEADLEKYLGKIRKWCDQGIPFRILAARFKAYQTVVAVLRLSLDKGKAITSHLNTLTSIMTGYPDVFDDKGADLLMQILTVSQDPPTLVACLKWAQVCCVMHERNRQAFSYREIHSLITILLEQNNDINVIVETCELIKLLTLDDDIREEISRAHEHARLLAINNLCILCDLLGKNKNEMVLAAPILSALSAIVVRNEFCEKVDQAGGIIHILDILAAHPDTEKVNLQCLKMIKVLAGNDDVKSHLMQAGASPLLLAAMSRHKGSSHISAAGCSCIAALALRCPDNAQVLVDNGAADALIDALKIHYKSGKVQRVACLAIRNCVSRNKALCQSFLDLGVEELLNAVDRHASWDEAKAALRDLGCNVKLDEPFTGKGVKLSHGD